MLSRVGLNMFDLVDQTYYVGTPLTYPNANKHYSACIFNNKLYICGRDKSDTSVSNLDVYDLSTGSQSSLASAPVKRVGHRAVMYSSSFENVAHQYDEMIFTFSGLGDSSNQGKMLAYCVGNNTQYQSDAAARRPRYQYCMLQDGSNIYIVGGMDSSGNFIRYVDKFDCEYDSWDTTGGLLDTTDAVAYAQAVLYDGKIYLWGGQNNDNFKPIRMYIYDTADKTQSNGPSGGSDEVTYGRCQGATVVYNKAMWVWGGNGYSWDDFEGWFSIYKLANDSATPGDVTGVVDLSLNLSDTTLSNETYVYNPYGGSFTKLITQNTPSARFGHGIIRSKDKAYLINSYSTQQVFDPSSNYTDIAEYALDVTQDIGYQTEQSGEADPDNRDFGSDNTAGAHGQLRQFSTWASGGASVHVIVVVEGGGICKAVQGSGGSEFGANIQYDNNYCEAPYDMAHIIDMSTQQIYLGLPEGAKIKHVWVPNSIL